MKRTIRGSYTVRWKAEDGKPGEDAVYYKLKVMKGGSVITSIPCDSQGIPKKVENVTVYLYRVVGRSETLCSDYYWYMSGMNKGTVVYSSQGIGSAFTFAVNRTDVDSFRVRVYEASNMGGNIIVEVMVPKVLDGTQGEKGYSGCVSRVFENGHTLGQTYRNDSELDTTSIRYLDFVCLEDSSFSSGYAVYRCKLTHISTSGTAPENATYWEKLDINANAGFFVYLIAKNANIKMLTGSKFSVINGNGEVCGCLCAGSYPLFIGGETANVAPFKVSIAGVMAAEGAIVKNSILQNVKITGTVRQPWSKSGIYISVGGSGETMSFDNIAAGASGGWGDGSINSMITWTLADSGRTMRIANWKFDGETFTGTVDVTAPSGKYFFEDGIQKTKLTLSREVIELMGYGDSSNFYGWIVLNRVDFMTTKKYGSCKKVLFSGVVSNGTMISQKTFDGSKLTSSRIGTGYYQVTFPYSVPHDEYAIHLTGYTCVRGNDIIYASVSIQNPNYFTTVYTGDDSSPNDGGFTYEVISTADWT